jgi:hypothetical protein
MGHVGEVRVSNPLGLLDLKTLAQADRDSRQKPRTPLARSAAPMVA